LETPPATSPDERTQAAIALLLELLDAHRPYLTSSPALLRRQLAATGLWRCRALLDAMVTLHRANRRDTVGLVFRSLVEVWLVSLYVLFRDGDNDEVLFALFADQVRLTKIVAEKMGGGPELLRLIEERRLEVQESQRSFPADEIRQLPSYEQIARELEGLTKNGVGGASRAMLVYDQVYRNESLTSSHANIYALMQHLDVIEGTEPRFAVAAESRDHPRTERLGYVRLSAAGQLVGYLAANVFHEFRVSVQPPLEQVLASLDDGPPLTEEAVEGETK
jgi:hypothetical protein